MKSSGNSARPEVAAGLSALVLAGGRGTRFWPESRASRPKTLFSIDGRRTLLADTMARIAPLVSPERVFVLVGAGQERLFKRALAGLIPARNLLVEPEGRGTAVAIAYGCAVIRVRAGEGAVAVMPADHYVAPASGFRRTIAAAARLAASHEAIVVVGVKPTRPETGYGYQKIGGRVDGGFRVERFVEKPPAGVARRMVSSGGFLWNAGIFVMTNRALSAELKAHVPALKSAIERLLVAPARPFARAYRRLEFDSFDREVVEKSRRVLGVRARFRWHDVGSWEGLWEALRRRDGNVLGKGVLALEASGVLARSSGRRLLVLLGVRDLVVVDTGDAVLVAGRSRAQDLRRVNVELMRRGLGRYL